MTTQHLGQLGHRAFTSRRWSDTGYLKLAFDEDEDFVHIMELLLA